ncbi:MAG: hypothetical protein HY907_07050 [Deltaproteobacteria bacterium]|nr:hypothetical protein [Deltaproteobacteria bacterium]
MAVNSGLLIGWTRPYVGREKTAQPKFEEYIGYLAKLQAEKKIESFEPVLCDPTGHDTLGGFFLVRGDQARLAEIQRTEEWRDWLAFGTYNLDGFRIVGCALGESIPDRMKRWQKQF